MGVAPTKTELVDLFWRSAWTWVAAFIGLLSANGLDVVSLDLEQMAKVSALSVLTTVVKVFASNKLGTGTGTDRATPAVGLQPVASNSATPATP
jgi:hypothetical protein